MEKISFSIQIIQNLWSLYGLKNSQSVYFGKPKLTAVLCYQIQNKGNEKYILSQYQQALSLPKIRTRIKDLQSVRLIDYAMLI